MSDSGAPFSRPERILLVLARSQEDCRGKAVRLSDASEFHFNDVAELASWLRDGIIAAPRSSASGGDDDEA